MKFLFTLLALFTVAFAAPTQLTKLTSRFSEAELAELRRRVEGCNANVCFAIDGSGSINETEYNAQLIFVLDVVSVIAVDNPVELAAVQYGTANSAISPLTVDAAEFIIKVNEEGQLRSGATFVAGGINYCFSQLFRRRGEANKIVLLGDGRSSIGANAVRRADLFRRVGGDVCAVGAGFTDDAELLAIAGGDPNRVFKVDNFLEVLDFQFILEAIVEDICNVEPEE